MKAARFVCGVVVLVCASVAVFRGIPSGARANGSDARVSPAPSNENSSALASDAAKARVAENFGKLPLYFERNQGQTDPHVSYLARARDTEIYFTAEGVTFALSERPQGEVSAGAAPHEAALRPAVFREEPERGATTARWILKLEFVDANPHVQPIAREKTAAVVSYFKGPKTAWKTGLPTYTSVVYPNVWPGIDLVFSGTSRRLKYTFIVQPGADPKKIRLAYRGATALRVNEAGQLEVSGPTSGFRDDKPYAYQEISGQRVTVDAGFALDAGNEASRHVYGFRVGAYDPKQPLVLDPVTLVYAGFIGGSRWDRAQAIAVDATGNAYVTGYTDSTQATFPVTVGPDLTFNGYEDAFVAKVKADGTGLLYAGYIGGSGESGGEGVAVDAAGNAYVTGSTGASGASFPVTVGPDLTHNGERDAFVAKVNAAGTGLVYAGYIGGSAWDIGHGIAVDSLGNAYVAGETVSGESTFPVTVGPDLTYNGGTMDAFVAKVKVDGTGLVYAGYIGGSGYDYGYGIAVDGAGNTYVTGRTESTEVTFPVAVGPDLTYNGGTDDAFVVKVSADGTGLVYAGYIGGDSYDWGLGIAVDAAGNAYITGFTFSTEATFPVAVGPDTTSNGPTDAFVAKVKADGTGLVYAGYIGGSHVDYGYGIAVDASGNAYVTGCTLSAEATFPVLLGPDLTFNGSFDAFVAKVKADGTGLDYAGYIGGSDYDYGLGIAADAAGNAYVTGYTGSTEATFPVTVGPDLTWNDNWDAFVAKVAMIPDSDLSLSKADSPDPVVALTPLTYTLAISNAGPDIASNVSLTDTLPASVIYVTATSSQGTCAEASGTVTCNLGTLANAASATVTIGVTPAAPGTIINSASVSSAGNDPNPANNTATEPTTVVDLTPPSVTVVRPNGGDKLFTGTAYTIAWTAADNVGLNYFDVEYSTNSGGTYTAVPGCTHVSGAQTSCVWAAPGPLTSTARVRVRAYDFAGLSSMDASNSNFSIVNGTGSITVTAPNTAVDWGVGSAQQIKWNHTLGLTSYVKIEVSRDGGGTWSVITDSFKNTGAAASTFNWVVTGPATDQARIRVSWAEAPSISDTSNTDFLISKPYIVAAAPNTTATSFGYGTARKQLWTTNLGPGDKVRVVLSTDGGATFALVLATNMVASVKTANFTTPVLAAPTDAARIRVEWLANPAVQGTDPVDFRVEPPEVRVTSPNGPADVWPIGGTKNVTWWSNLGATENVKIELSLDGGSTYPIVLSASTPSDGTQSVTVLAGWATQLGRVRITWLTNGTVSDTSNQNFPIQ